MLAFYLTSVTVNLADGPDEVEATFSARRDRLVSMLAMHTEKALDERYQRMMRLDKAFFKLAGALIQGNPAIFG